ncbi:MAG: type II toxin-antitoxin system RelE/ParE family toxin [Betaproteobacteria bacterium]|nr:type II toxin-antitoxin system RelE/ParE family toxin [Betaproteobacteria bacterium]
MIPCKFHPDADAELEEAALFYESRLPGLGKAFAAEVAQTISLVREFPESGTPLGSRRRRVIIARFPYSIVYRHDPDAIVIVAVAHQRRRPGYWRRRK